MNSKVISSSLALTVLSICWQQAEAGSTKWVYEAEIGPRSHSEVAQAIKDRDASGGMARIAYRETSRQGQVAFAGPMTMEQPPGTYRVVFRAKVEDNTNSDTVLRLSVWQEGLGMVVTRDVKASDFAASGKYQDFTLEFTRVPGGLVSTYIYWRGGLWEHTRSGWGEYLDR